MTHAQYLELKALLKNNQSLLYALLYLQGVEQAQIQQLVDAADNAEQVRLLVNTLKRPTEALAAVVKENQ